MARGRSIPKNTEAASVEKAILDNDWGSARYAMAVKLGRMFDHTDSARDVKAISLSLTPLVDACEAATRGDVKETPLDSILAEAEKVIANA